MNPGWRIIDLTGFCGAIKYERGCLRVVSPDTDQRLPLAQLAVMLIGVATSISGAALAKLGEYDVAVLVCDWKGIPVAGAFSWNPHTRIGARQRAQSELTTPRRKQAWAATVTAKVRGQVATAEALTGSKQPELRALAKSVRSGDSGNVEAIAAKKYWATLNTPGDFRRRPGGGEDIVNSALDYGYTVLRGHGIRAVNSAGLAGALGMFHRGRSNQFNLVDDLIEPFRPMVDQVVFRRCGLDDGTDLTREAKQELITSINLASFDRTGRTVPTALEESAQSYGQYVEGELKKFVPPTWDGDLSASNRE
ncbi:subtype II CRISPR-associated endonuclease Cas1 [Corynebacterium hadale]|uniref:CRISPR-associated endonuclease Cas1 n=1 Tax=Corynebacterium hadale TaxID=2026255 RepID=A0ABX4H9W5_9CORY|nr:type II CRISPR-associated endonuclease Cas1 [Corynebacterium hadale]PAT06110.1 subtype II CRISPR-associated endonuclease Cas1 [Corynebacterium hadale]